MTPVPYNPDDYECCGGTACKNCVCCRLDSAYTGLCLSSGRRVYTYQHCDFFTRTQQALRVWFDWHAEYYYRPVPFVDERVTKLIQLEFSYGA